MEADITSQAVGLGANTDFSLMSLFLRADIIVKSVMIILIVCSIYSWAVIIEKLRLFKKINKSKVPLMINLLKTIMSNKKLKIKV